MLLYCVDEDEAHPPGPGHQLRGEDPLRLLPPLHREGGRLRKEGFPSEFKCCVRWGGSCYLSYGPSRQNNVVVLQNHEIARAYKNYETLTRTQTITGLRVVVRAQRVLFQIEGNPENVNSMAQCIRKICQDPHWIRLQEGKNDPEKHKTVTKIPFFKGAQV
jgi:hypothetical protein